MYNGIGILNFSSELCPEAVYLASSIFDSLPGEEKVENGGNLNRAMHKLQKAKMKSGNAEIFGRNLHKSL